MKMRNALLSVLLAFTCVSSKGQDKKPGIDHAQLLEQLENYVNALPADTLDMREKMLIRGLFGDQINLNKVCKHFGKNNLADLIHLNAIVPKGDTSNMVFFLPSVQTLADPAHAEHFLTFVHEMTHIWQNQQGQLYTRAPKNMDEADILSGKAYQYTLDAQSPFTSFTPEQQGAIMTDYAAVVFLKGDVSMSCLNDKSVDIKDLLYKTVETQFPDAKVTRLTQEIARMQAASRAARQNIPLHGFD